MAKQWLQGAGVAHWAAIAGRVTDAITGRGIGGAQVRLQAPPAFAARLRLVGLQHGERWDLMAERPDRTQTRADGHFHFIDLPPGDYTVEVELPGCGSRYAPASAGVAVRRDEQGAITLATLDLKLPATALTGKITGPDGKPLLLAEVRLADSGERAFSDAAGAYRLTALEAGRRSIQIVARGLQPQGQVVTLSRGQLFTLDVQLSAPPMGAVAG